MENIKEIDWEEALEEQLEDIAMAKAWDSVSKMLEKLTADNDGVGTALHEMYSEWQHAQKTKHMKIVPIRIIKEVDGVKDYSRGFQIETQQDSGEFELEARYKLLIIEQEHGKEYFCSTRFIEKILELAWMGYVLFENKTWTVIDIEE